MSEPFNNLLSGYIPPDRRRRIANALMADQFDRPTPQDGPVTERAGLFPLGTYANGQTGVAFPGLIAQPVESFANLLRRGYQGGTGDTQGVEDAFNVAGGALVGGIASPKPANALGIFGGRLAKTADQAALARAEDMAARGVPREQIWIDTGWFQGVDGKWRFEIDDRWLGVSRFDADTRAKFGDVIRQPHLYAAYPEMKHGRFSSIDANFAAYLDNMMKIGTRNKDKRSDIAHELQHGVQEREGFGFGGNAKDVPSGNYRRMSGEVEARAVQRRMDMTPEQRRARFPWLDYDVPEADQIVRFPR